MYRAFVIGSVLLLNCVPSARPLPPASESSAARLAPSTVSSEEGLPYLMPEGILERLERAGVKHHLQPDDSPPGGCAPALWPESVPVVEFPRVVLQEGKRVIEPWPLTPRVEALLAQAAEHLEASRHHEAEKLSRQVLAECPDCYMALETLGEIAMERGQYPTALGLFQQALAINPDDAHLYMGRGIALLQMARRSEARASFAQALVLAPRDPTLRQWLAPLRGVGMEFRGDVLVPRGYAYQKNGEVFIQHDPRYGPAWLAFGRCKALWHVDAAHRQEMTGKSERHFNSVEEYECLGAAARVHAAQKENRVPGIVDPTLDRLLEVMEDGMITELVFFESTSRVHPQIHLTLDDTLRQRIEAFVLKFVLVEEHPSL